MQLLSRYSDYWIVFVGGALFLALGLWWRVTASRAFELVPKPLDWVRNYRSGTDFFHKEPVDDTPHRKAPFYLTLLAALLFAAFHLLTASRLTLAEFGSRYAILFSLLRFIGTGAVYLLVHRFLGSAWVAMPAALLFAASPVRGSSDTCFLAGSLLLLLCYLQAKKPGFSAEWLYFASCLTFAFALSLRPALIWLVICFPLVHWYKLGNLLRRGQLTGRSLLWYLLAAAGIWILTGILSTLLFFFRIAGFQLSALTKLMRVSSLRSAFRLFASMIRNSFFSVPTRGMVLELLLDAPLLGFGFWGCFSAWKLGKLRRNASGIAVLVVLVVLTAAWLLTGRYLLTLGLTLCTACMLREADLGKKRWICISVAVVGLCWYCFIQIAAWNLPLTEGLLERLR